MLGKVLGWQTAGQPSIRILGPTSTTESQIEGEGCYYSGRRSVWKTNKS